MSFDITAEKFDSLLDTNVAITLRMVQMGVIEGIQPMLIVHGMSAKDEETIAVIGLGNEDFADKKYELVAQAGREYAKQAVKTDASVPIAVFMVSEAWLKQFKDELPKDLKPAGEYEDREEVVIVAGKTANGMENMATYPLLRDDEGSISLGEKLNYVKAEDGGTKSELLAAFYEGAAREYEAYILNAIKKGFEGGNPEQN